MPRGISRYDEARLQGRLWTPRMLGAKLVGWWDYSDPLPLASGGGSFSSFQDKSGNGRPMIATGSPTWQPVSGPSGRGAINVTVGNHLGVNISQATFPGSGSINAGLVFASVWKRVSASGIAYYAGPMNRSSVNIPAPIDSWGGFRFAGDGYNNTNNTSSIDFATSSDVGEWNVFSQSLIEDPVFRLEEKLNGIVTCAYNLTYYGDNGTTIDVGTRADGSTNANMLVAEQIATKGLTLRERLLVDGYLAWSQFRRGGVLKNSPFANRPPLIGD